jgi:hypothetical protein
MYKNVAKFDETIKEWTELWIPCGGGGVILGSDTRLHVQKPYCSYVKKLYSRKCANRIVGYFPQMADRVRG